MSLRELFPASESFASDRLAVGDSHLVYYEQSGNPEGIPVIFLHGGPGAGATRGHARFFDPERYHVVLFDQRGVGQSTPSASEDPGIMANTTWHLVDDIVLLADHLSLGPFVVSGGSWGSTLALALAACHPNRVRGLILRGVITFQQRELDWFFLDGANRLFPDAYEAFLEPLPRAQHSDPLAAYHSIFFGAARPARDRAVRAWRAWSTRLSTLAPARGLLGEPSPRETGRHALARARLECLYSQRRAFMPADDWLMQHLPSLSHLPLHIIQGRYDLICPLEAAYRLHRSWSGSQLHLTHAGHSAFEPENVDGLLQAQESLANRLASQPPPS